MAARAWFANRLFDRGDAAPDVAGDATLAMAREGGMSEDAIAALAGSLARHEGMADEAGEYRGVWPQHLASVRAFLAAASQWRTSPAGFTGIDYGGAEIAWRRLGIDLSSEAFAAFQVIEGEATRLMNGGSAA